MTPLLESIGFACTALCLSAVAKCFRPGPAVLFALVAMSVASNRTQGSPEAHRAAIKAQQAATIAACEADPKCAAQRNASIEASRREADERAAREQDAAAAKEKADIRRAVERATAIGTLETRMTQLREAG